MATYKEIKGTQIEVLASDPSNPVEGQVWYNSTSTTLKGQIISAVGAWATVAELNTGVQGGAAAGVSNSSSLSFGGEEPTITAKTESYNGSAWTEVNDLNTARSGLGGNGTQTSALAYGGANPSTVALAKTNSWNGSTWTEVNDINTARRGSPGSAGEDNESALMFAGYIPPSGTGHVNNTEKWNGTNWTTVTAMNTARYSLGGGGIVTSALAFGGYSTAQQALTEYYNGSNWTAMNVMNEARYNLGGTGATYNASMAFGGQPGLGPSSAKTEIFTGTNWAEDGDLNSARVNIRGSGTTTSALAFGGEGPPPARPFTEAWSGAGTSTTKTFTVS